MSTRKLNIKGEDKVNSPSAWTINLKWRINMTNNGCNRNLFIKSGDKEFPALKIIFDLNNVKSADPSVEI